VRFADLAAAYDQLEATSSRLEMRHRLAELVRPLRDGDLEKVLYLSQGLLRPEYEGVELGVADSLARRAVALATGEEEANVARRAKTSGDLGLTTQELLTAAKRLAGEPLTVREVYATMTSIAAASGEGSQEAKVRALVDLLGRASPSRRSSSSGSCWGPSASACGR